MYLLCMYFNLTNSNTNIVNNLDLPIIADLLVEPRMICHDWSKTLHGSIKP